MHLSCVFLLIVAHVSLSSASNSRSADASVAYVDKNEIPNFELEESVASELKCLSSCLGIPKCQGIYFDSQENSCRTIRTDVTWVESDGGNSTVQIYKIAKSYHPHQGYYTDCRHIYEMGLVETGVYTIKPDGVTDMTVVCEMDVAPGGWMVIQQRIDGSVDFYRNWMEYANGFGNVTASEEFWVGLETIHSLSASDDKEIMFWMEAFDGVTAYARFSTFSVSGAADNYRLSIADYTGTAGDANTFYTQSGGQQFTTPDQDNDAWVANCAVRFKCPFWMKNCHAACPNGQYHASPGICARAEGITWANFRTHYESMKAMKMLIRRK